MSSKRKHFQTFGSIALAVIAWGCMSNQKLNHHNEKEVLKSMSQQLNTVTKQLARFGTTKSIDPLRGAIEIMESLPYFENDSSSASRKEQIGMWLHVLTVIEENLSPNFDPNATVQMNLTPPKTREGVEYPSGIDPRAIADPVARQEYEAALKKNREKAERLNFQSGLHQLQTQVKSDIERYLKNSGTPTATIQKEFREVLADSKLSSSRKKELTAFVSNLD